jgi:hypothetical protein
MTEGERVGLSVPIWGETRIALVALNGTLKIHGFGDEISFGPEGTSDPHLTVLLGTLRRGALPDLLQLAGSSAVLAPRSNIQLSDRPVVSGARGYVVVPAQLTPEFAEWRRSVQEGCRDLFQDIGPVSEQGHVTVGHRVTPHELPATRLLSVVFEATHLDLATAGVRGRKESLIERFEFNS